MSCYKTAQAKSKAQLVQLGVIDRFYNIKHLGRLRTLVRQWSEHAKQKYGTTERLFLEDGDKVVPNEKMFQIIDHKNGIKYKKNQWVGASIPTVPLSEEELATAPEIVDLEPSIGQRQAESPSQITPELKEKLLAFLQSVNPNFRVEHIENLSANGVAKVYDFLIQLKAGNESALTEEVAHVYVELLTGDLRKEMMSAVVYTRMYDYVINEYKGKYTKDGKPDYERLKREAAAKLLSLAITDREAFEYWTGSPELQNMFQGIIRKILAFLKKIRNPFEQAAKDIMDANSSNLDVNLAKYSQDMYQLEMVDELSNYQTLGVEPSKFDRMYINLNDTILDLATWVPPGVTAPADIKKLKREMWFDVAKRNILNNYYQNAQFTKLGRELKDKIKLYGPHKVTIFTSAPLTDELIARLQGEFGPVSIVRTTTVQPNLVTINGVDNVLEENVEKKLEYLKIESDKFSKGRILIVDNQRTNAIKSPQPNAHTVWYSNRAAKYTDFETKRSQQKKKSESKEFSQAVQQEIQAINTRGGKESMISLVKQSLNIVRNVIAKLEKGDQFEELTETFKDEYGNLNLPAERASTIRRLLEDSSKFEEAILNFVQTIESTRYFFNIANEAGFGGKAGQIGLKELADSNDPADNEKAIREAAILMRNILSWEEWITNIEPHIKETKVIRGVISNFRDELRIANQHLNDIALQVLSKNLSEEWKETNKVFDAQLAARAITPAQHAEKVMTPQKMLDWLTGKYGDAHKFSAYENPLMINEPIISTLSKKIEILTQQADEVSLKESTKISQELWKIGEEIGLSDYEIGKLINYEDGFATWENGVYVVKKAKFLLNRFKNTHEWDVERQKFFNAKDAWLEVRNSTAPQVDKDRLEAEFKQAKLNWERFVETNWHDELTVQAKHIYESIPGLVDADFETASERQKEIRDRISDIEAQLRVPYLTEADEQAFLADLENEVRNLRLLRNEYDEFGNKKTGLDLIIAQKLRAKTKIDNQIYESKVDQKKFLDAAKEQINSLPDVGLRTIMLGYLNADNVAQLYNFAKLNAPQSFVDWLELNTRVQYSEDFYEQRKEILDELSQRTEEALDTLPLDVRLRVQTLNEQMKLLWEEITNMTSYLRDGNMQFDASDSSPDVQLKVKQFEEDIEEIKYLLGEARREGEAPDVSDLIDELTYLQSKEPTPYYNEVMHEWLSGLYQHGMSPSMDFRTVINSSEFRTWLEEPGGSRKAAFKQWFERNHLELDRWTGDEEDGGEGWVTSTVPTYIWRKTVPNNPEHIKVVPSAKYTKREMKEVAFIEEVGADVRLKTEKNADTWDPIKRRWLPKTARYINQDYENLKNSTDPKDKLLFKYLDKLSTYYLSLQDRDKDTPRNSVLGYMLPFMHKQYAESGKMATAWKTFTNKVNPREEGQGADPAQTSTLKAKWAAFIGLETPEQEAKQVRTDYLGNQIKTIYTPYTSYLEVEDTTNDALLSVISYGHGVERVRAMVKAVPQIDLLDQILKQFLPQAKGTKNQYGATIPSQTNNRYNLLQHIKRVKLYGDFKDFELGRGVDTFLYSLRQVVSVTSQSALNAPNIVKNLLQGQLMNYILGNSYDWATKRTVAAAISHEGTSFAKYMYEMTKEQKSIDFHILSFFNPSLKNSVTNSVNQNAKRGAASRNLQDSNVYFFTEYQDFAVSSTLLYAHLLHKKVELNGQTLNLKDAFEVVDGGLQFKQGVMIDGVEATPRYLQELKLKFKVILEEVQGKQWNPTLMEKYTIWQSILFFKRFFIPGLRKRFFTKRQNPVLGETEGYYITTARYLLAKMYSMIYGGQYEMAMTADDRIRIKQTRDEFLLSIATLMIITLGFGFTSDDEDEDRWEKLADKGWLHNMALMIAINVKRETDGLTPFPMVSLQNSLFPPVANETFNFITEPFIGFSQITEGKKLLDSAISLGMDEQDAYYDRDQPQYFIDKGDSKFVHYLQKFTSIDNFLYMEDPIQKIKVMNSFAKSK